MTLLDLSADDVLNTTRAVRKRLDFSRPVEDDVIRECVATAMQAPSGSNLMTMQFVVVKDAEKREAIGEIYKQCWAIYSSMPQFAGAIKKEGESEQAQQDRVVDSATYLSEHMADAPRSCSVHGRPRRWRAGDDVGVGDGQHPAGHVELHARCRAPWAGHRLDDDLADDGEGGRDIVGIPFDEIQQACLTPLAYTVGTDFERAMRPDPDTIIHWDTW